MLGTKFLILGLSLISCVAGALYPNGQIPPGQVIGYRTVRAKQAHRWMRKGTVTPDGNENNYQIGKGQYTSPKAGDWFGKGDDKYCVITADPIKWAEAPKAWIPHYDADGNTLWGNANALLAQEKYLRGLGLDPEKVFRMSIIDGFPDKLQMVIPDAMTNSRGGGMGLKVDCKDNLADFEDNKPEVDYYQWPNVSGEPQYPTC